MTRARLARLSLLVVLAAASASCAYYNTFYLARRYYLKATDGQPYEVDREGTAQRANYAKSADYSKKVLGVHPKSKWVDDAWLMWARTFVGTDDPLKAVAMLQEFETRFPGSDLRPEAEFFLGLSYRTARRHDQAVNRLDNFIAQAPRNRLVPYAWYERSKALLALRRYREAAESAGQVLEHFPKHVLVDRALRQRAEARFQQQDWAGARADFASIGERALTDEDRLRYLLREVDCLEADRRYDDARALLRDARAHVPQPPPPPTVARVGPTAGAAPAPVQRPAATVAGQDRYGRITLRMGSVELLAGRVEEAIRLYESVILDYPRTALAAEAQFRIGYAWETGADDFARARLEYLKVKEQAGTSQFSQQAQQRTDNLDRIERFRTATGADSAARQAESRFLTAEHYVFNLDRPERALEEYRAIADSSRDSSVIARALNAQAWVLSRKLERGAEAESLFWRVVRDYPGTEAQLAARDYLESEGETVPEGLIVAPTEFTKPVLEPEPTLTPFPGGTPRLGRPRSEPELLRPGTTPGAPETPPADTRDPAVPDSVFRVLMYRDSLTSAARKDTSAAGRARLDSLRRSFFVADTTGRAAELAAIQRVVPRPEGVVVAPGGGVPPVPRQEPGGPMAPRTPPLTGQPLPSERGVDRVLLGADRADSLRRATGADSLVPRPGVAPPFTPPAAATPSSAAPVPGEPGAAPRPTAPEPEADRYRRITSFERKPRDPAAIERQKQEKQRAKAVRDSVRQAKRAEKAAGKAARKAQRQAPAGGAAVPPVPATRPDSASSPARADTTSGGHR